MLKLGQHKSYVLVLIASCCFFLVCFCVFHNLKTYSWLFSIIHSEMWLMKKQNSLLMKMVRHAQPLLAVLAVYTICLSDQFHLYLYTCLLVQCVALNVKSTCTIGRSGPFAGHLRDFGLSCEIWGPPKRQPHYNYTLFLSFHKVFCSWRLVQKRKL